MLLHRRAFDLFLGLTSEDQRSYDAVKAALSEAFGPDLQEAFEQFRSRSIQPAESIEEYRSSRRRLATVICMGQEPQEYFLRQAFLAGLPTEVSKHLLSEVGKENKLLRDLIPMALSLLRINTRTEKAVEPTSGGGVASASNVMYGANQRQGFRCNRRGHLQRDCKASLEVKEGPSPVSKFRACFI